MTESMRQWTITVDYVPGQNWEAAIESDGDYGPGGFEAENPHDLLASVAAELQAEVQAGRGDTMTERKFYRTRITFEVLSDEPIHPYMDIAGIVAECDDGGYVMDSNQPVGCVTVELSGAEMAQALHNAGSTPEFFQLDDAGNPIEEDDDGPS